MDVDADVRPFAAASSPAILSLTDKPFTNSYHPIPSIPLHIRTYSSTQR